MRRISVVRLNVCADKDKERASWRLFLLHTCTVGLLGSRADVALAHAAGHALNAQGDDHRCSMWRTISSAAEQEEGLVPLEQPEQPAQLLPLLRSRTMLRMASATMSATTASTSQDPAFIRKLLTKRDESMWGPPRYRITKLLFRQFLLSVLVGAEQQVQDGGN